MAVIDLHPEELLAKERDKILTDEERALLDAHLRACHACRLLRQAREDFSAERASWQPNNLRVSLLSPGLMKELEQHARSTGAQSRAKEIMGGRPWRFRSRHRARFLIAALAAIGPAAAASGWWATGRFGLHPESGDTVVAGLSHRGQPVGKPAAPPPPQCTTARSSVDSGQAPMPERVLAESVPTVPALPRPTTKAAFNEPAERVAAKLFDRATQARVAGDYREALRLYRELERRFPASSESLASRATVARLLLDTGQPDAALADLGQYLEQRSGALAEEAMVNRAVAYQRMGLRTEERGAWQALLRAYPGSLHATRAQSRVNALDAGKRE